MRKYVEKMKLFGEMKAVGLKTTEIAAFTLIGVALWAVLLWMFVSRYQEIDDDLVLPDNHLKNITSVIIGFHSATLVLTLLETYYMNSNIWVSWLTIGLALSATFLNAASLAIIVTDYSFNYENIDVERSIASLILQCIANALMTAYIFKLIRSKRKISY